MPGNMTPMSDLVDLVEVKVENCPPKSTARACVNSLRSFCEKTDKIRKSYECPITEEKSMYTLAEIVGDGDELDYYDFTRAVYAYSYRFEENIGTGLYMVSVDDMDKAIPNWRSKVSTGNISSSLNYVVIDDSLEDGWRICTYPYKIETSLDETLGITLSYKPKRKATEFPSILEDYIEEIACGAASELMMMPRKRWSDKAGARMYMHEFNKAITREKVKRAKGFSRRNMRANDYLRLGGSYYYFN